MANKRITDVDVINSLNSDESFFVNQNSSIKQINKSDIVWDISNGGTNATNVAEARNNLDVYSKGETDSLMIKMNSNTIIIPADAWVQSDMYEGMYCANMIGIVPYVDEESIIFISPVEYPIENFDSYVRNKIRAIEQGLKTIKFIANTIPDIDISINYTVFHPNISTKK